MTDTEYKSLTFIKNVVEKKFSFPTRGKIVQFGVYGQTLEYLCKKFGKNRVIGFDNNTKFLHPCLKKFDLEKIGEEKNSYKIAFGDIDVGCFETHSQLRLKLLLWCSKRMVKNGLIMINSPMLTDNIWQEAGHDYMIRQGFICHRLIKYINEEWYQVMLKNTPWNPATTCLYQKK
jgi:hypothetical protein